MIMPQLIAAAAERGHAIYQKEICRLRDMPAGQDPHERELRLEQLRAARRQRGYYRALIDRHRVTQP